MAFAGDICNTAKMKIFVFVRIENIMRKGENASLPVFSPFLTFFQLCTTPWVKGLSKTLRDKEKNAGKPAFSPIHKKF